jgi:hypothetical protein
MASKCGLATTAANEVNAYNEMQVREAQEYVYRPRSEPRGCYRGLANPTSGVRVTAARRTPVRPGSRAG